MTPCTLGPYNHCMNQSQSGFSGDVKTECWSGKEARIFVYDQRQIHRPEADLL
jgi:hypothetical protein